MSPPDQSWDAELYEAKHSFVWELAGGVFDLLAPQAGERILDIGCGTGQLTSRFDAAGAAVLGIDSSPEMIGQARQNYPHITFALQDVTTMNFQSEFDAVFSNATLHWVLDAQAAARAIARALKPGGRFAAEFGGHGNIRHIETAIREAIANRGAPVPASRWYYPSVAEYSSVLEKAGLEVRLAELFDRPTPLEGARGMENWIEQFAAYYFEGLPRPDRNAAVTHTLEQLRPVLLRDGIWYADYRRIRVLAAKV